jgi:hypothetical protein
VNAQKHSIDCDRPTDRSACVHPRDHRGRQNSIIARRQPCSLACSTLLFFSKQSRHQHQSRTRALLIASSKLATAEDGQMISLRHGEDRVQDNLQVQREPHRRMFLRVYPSIYRLFFVSFGSNEVVVAHVFGTRLLVAHDWLQVIYRKRRECTVDDHPLAYSEFVDHISILVSCKTTALSF